MSADQTTRPQAFRDVRDAITRLRASAPDAEYVAGLWDALCAVGVAEKAPHGAVVPMRRETTNAE